MAATGLTGAAAITAALAFLGGPAGMLGGIAVLSLTGLIADALNKSRTRRLADSDLLPKAQVAAARQTFRRD